VVRCPWSVGRGPGSRLVAGSLWHVERGPGSEVRGCPAGRGQPEGWRGENGRFGDCHSPVAGRSAARRMWLVACGTPACSMWPVGLWRAEATDVFLRMRRAGQYPPFPHATSHRPRTTDRSSHTLRATRHRLRTPDHGLRTVLPTSYELHATGSALRTTDPEFGNRACRPNSLAVGALYVPTATDHGPRTVLSTRLALRTK